MHKYMDIDLDRDMNLDKKCVCIQDETPVATMLYKDGLLWLTVLREGYGDTRMMIKTYTRRTCPFSTSRCYRQRKTMRQMLDASRDGVDYHKWVYQ